MTLPPGWIACNVRRVNNTRRLGWCMWNDAWPTQFSQCSRTMTVPIAGRPYYARQWRLRLCRPAAQPSRRGRFRRSIRSGSRWPDDGSPEFRLAVALGSAARLYFKREGKCLPVDPVRHHWLPLESGARRYQTHDKRLAHDSRVVISGRDAPADCAALVERRLIEATQRGERRLPLVAAPGGGAFLLDLADLLAGHVDLERVWDLARALMAVRWHQLKSDLLPTQRRHDVSTQMPDEAWLALRLACLPWPLAGRDISAEPEVMRRLRSGDGTGAFALARRRLQASGIRLPLQVAFTDPYTARLWAATLAFPIHHSTACRAAAILDPRFNGE